MEFHQFPKLPTELRFRIWSFTLPTPREFGPIGPKGTEPQSTKDSTSNLNESGNNAFLEFEIPALHINHESRTVALQHLTRAWDDNASKVIYVNYSLDTFTFTSIDYLLHLVRRSGLMHGGGPFPSCKDMKNMQRIKITFTIQSLNLHLRMCLERVLQPFDVLREIVVVVKMSFQGDVYRSNSIEKSVAKTITDAKGFAREILEKSWEGRAGKVPRLVIEELRV
ncbi:hypothetical protein ONS95_004130 [Cadophora gregata]|uniref:uncharacterized protein n=1 Tax=Cadophora gregata TaxID=51156 RepID=UPI0026DD52DB|nr:uncharacterized protein ONS95_004130 [Cadophora gregata]KAK0105509.1 hypothetical protein ONS96_004895 [Cadophora gregata f. sp. sojae]KAK0105598.1 hypothetical protein ONS95_004130 [Cadophora gregata]